MAEIYPLPDVISPYAPRVTPPRTGSPARAERISQREMQLPPPQPPPRPPEASNRGNVVDIQA